MGVAASLPSSFTEDKAGRRSKSIDLSLAEDRQKLLNIVQILLIGEGDSGKSTFSKQVRLIFNKGFSRSERIQFRKVVRDNVVSALLAVLSRIRTLTTDIFDMDDIEDDFLIAFNALRSNDAADVIVDIKETIVRVVGHQRFQACLVMSPEYLNFQHAARQYLGCLERILSPDYIPTDQDILRSNSKTVGIQETTFSFKGLDYRVCDSGGQSSLCRKWIHCFENVSAVIFTVDMGSYDRVSPDGDGKNSLRQSIEQFQEICNHPCFGETSIFLFLNKKDLMERKLKSSPLTTCFPEYKGGNDYAEVSRYIQWQFERVANPGRIVHSHFTTATDTGTIRQVVDSCLGVILHDIYKPGLY